MHVPYFESDHVLNLAYNVMTGGTCLEDIDRLRDDTSYTTSLAAERFLIRPRRVIFCDGSSLPTSRPCRTINQARREVWRYSRTCFERKRYGRRWHSRDHDR